MQSGVALLDDVLGGIAKGSSLVLAGSSGSGRTVLSLQLAAAAIERGERVAILTFEPPTILLRQARSLEFELDEAIRSDQLVVLEAHPRVAASVRKQGGFELAGRMRDAAPDAGLVVLDSLNALTAELVDEPSLRDAIESLFAIPTASPAITVATLDVGANRRGEDPHLMRAVSDQSEVLLRLQRAQDGSRTIQVEHSRTGCEQAGTVAFEIGPGGLRATRRLPAPVRADVDPPAAPEARGRRPRVLVIQEHESDREFVRNSLVDRYEVMVASSGFEALALVLGEDPDLVILDLVLSGVSGLQVLSALKSAPDAPPVLMTTGGERRSEDWLRAKIAGAEQFVRRPIPADELVKRVESLLQVPRSTARSPEAEDAASLIVDPLHGRLLDEAEFGAALTRACRLNQNFDQQSVVLSFEARHESTIDDMLAVLDRVLRYGDCMTRRAHDRVSVLLPLTDRERLPSLLKRLGAAFSKASIPVVKLHWAAMTVEQAAAAERWDAWFEHLEPMSKRGRRSDKTA